MDFHIPGTPKPEEEDISEAAPQPPVWPWSFPPFIDLIDDKDE